MSPSVTNILKVALPIVVLLGGSLGAWAIIATQPELETEAPEVTEPLAQVISVQPERVRLDIRSQGVVAPRNEIDLVAEVAGKILSLHPSLVAGGFFDSGDTLVAIDSRDYDYAIVEAEGRIAEARRQLTLEDAQAEQARSEWQALGEGKAPTPLTLREPYVAEARAKLRAAEADLAKARLHRERCHIRAPFAGRVQDKKVGVGQYIQPGEKLAHIYSIDAAEIRLPLSADQLGWLDLPLGRHDGRAMTGPKVRLTAEFAGARPQWEGRIVRTEGNLDQTTGLLYAVAEVRNPYAVRAGQPPLMAGLFVQAEIEGREQADVFVLPIGAVNASQEVLLVDDQRRLHIRRLAVLRSEADRVLVRGGLAPGDRIVTAGVQIPVDGMRVRLDGDEATPAAAEPSQEPADEPAE
ncbi:MAG: efflux RND transporter periplasmic adaptor subunit [Methylotetracoccus sp.]